jgi:hypothetical protein
MSTEETFGVTIEMLSEVATSTKNTFRGTPRIPTTPGPVGIGVAIVVEVAGVGGGGAGTGRVVFLVGGDLEGCGCVLGVGRVGIVNSGKVGCLSGRSGVGCR